MDYITRVRLDRMLCTHKAVTSYAQILFHTDIES